MSINIKEVKLEEALKRIFKHHSYVTYYDSDGNVDKVVIFSAKAGALKAIAKPTVGSQASPSSTGSPFSASTEESTRLPVRPGKASQSINTSQQTDQEENAIANGEDAPEELSPDTADVPYDQQRNNSNN